MLENLFHCDCGFGADDNDALAQHVKSCKAMTQCTRLSLCYTMGHLARRKITVAYVSSCMMEAMAICGCKGCRARQSNLERDAMASGRSLLAEAMAQMPDDVKVAIRRRPKKG